MIDTIVNIINDAIVLDVQKKHGWAQLVNDKPHVHVGEGQWKPVAEDAEGGWSYIRQTGMMSVNSEAITGLACGGVAINIPVRYCAMMRREDCDEMAGVLLGIAGIIRGTSRSARQIIQASTVDFGSIRVGIDEVFSNEFGSKAKMPLDKVFVNIDIVVSVTGDPNCLQYGCDVVAGEPYTPNAPCPPVRLCTDGLVDGNVPTWDGTKWVGATPGSGPSGSGDVTGPSSAVNNNFAAYNGTTGKIIKDSGSSAASFDAAGAASAAQAAAIAAAASDATTKANAAQAAAIASASTDATTKANAAQAFAIQRANHTGTQLAATISDLAATVRALSASTVLTYTGGSVVNNTTTLSDIDASAGFTIPAAGEYYYEFMITYDSAATVNGARFAVNGTATFSYLTGFICATVLSTDRSSGNFVAYDTGTVAPSSAGTSGNRALIQGHIIATSSGSFVPRFCSENNASAITVTNVIGRLQRTA